MSAHALHWIDGEWLAAGGGRSPTAECFAPATGNKVGTFTEGTRSDAEAAIAALRRAFKPTLWDYPNRLRAQVFLDFADLLAARRCKIKTVPTRVNGKLLRESVGEFAASISKLQYFACLSHSLFGCHAEIYDGCYSVLAIEPARVAGIIVPWNMPITLPIRSLASAMVAGCKSVIRTSHQTGLANGAVLKCLTEGRGLPEGAVNCATESGSIGAFPEVAVTSFTGSRAVGEKIMAAASGMLKMMTGKTSTTAARVRVHESIADALRAHFNAAFEKVAIRPGHDRAYRMGPMIDRTNRDRVLGLIEEAAEHGMLLVRGRILSGTLASGDFVTPTLAAFGDVDSPISRKSCSARFRFSKFSPTRPSRLHVSTPRPTAPQPASGPPTRCARSASAARFNAGTVWINSYNRLFAKAETGGYRESRFGRLHGFQELSVYRRLSTSIVKPRLDTTGASS